MWPKPHTHPHTTSHTFLIPRADTRVVIKSKSQGLNTSNKKKIIAVVKVLTTTDTTVSKLVNMSAEFIPTSSRNRSRKNDWDAIETLTWKPSFPGPDWYAGHPKNHRYVCLCKILSSNNYKLNPKQFNVLVYSQCIKYAIHLKTMF